MADLHLGYRQFTRLTKAGRNQREQDVSDTFLQAVAQIEALKPDLIVVAGDVFHVVRPSNQAIMDALAGFKRLSHVAPTVVIAGNHEDKVNSETPCILPMLKRVGCLVVWDATASVGGLPLTVVCVPERSALKWAGEFSGDVLLLHGEVEGALPFATSHAIPKASIKAEKWAYIALGHYHVRTDLWPNGGYAGSLDYVSTDIWTEARAGVPKGFIEYDTETKARTFHPTSPRVVGDLPVIDAMDWTFAKTEAAIIAAVEFCGLPDGSIVRQRVTNLTRTEWAGRDLKAIRAAGKRFLTLQVAPAVRKSEPRKTPQERKATLEGDLKTLLNERPLPADISRERFVELGLQYFNEGIPQIEVASE